MGGGMISFVPGALSGMGWLRTKNVHAQHACDHNRFSSIPATEEKKKKKGTGGERRKKKGELKHLHSVCKYTQGAAKHLGARGVCQSSCASTCVSARHKLVYL